MADTKISALTAASAAAGANEIAINEAGTSKKATVTQIEAFLRTRGLPTVISLGSAYTNATTTGTEVPLSFTLPAAGTYRAEWLLFMASAATTTSPKFGVNYTGTATRMMAHARVPSAGVSAATGQLEDAVNATTGQVYAYAATTTETTTAPNLGPWTGVVAANVNCYIIVDVLIVVSDTGDLELWAGSEVATSTITLAAGSSGILTRLA